MSTKNTKNMKEIDWSRIVFDPDTHEYIDRETGEVISELSYIADTIEYNLVRPHDKDSDKAYINPYTPMYTTSDSRRIAYQLLKMIPHETREEIYREYVEKGASINKIINKYRGIISRLIGTRIFMYPKKVRLNILGYLVSYIIRDVAREKKMKKKIQPPIRLLKNKKRIPRRSSLGRDEEEEIVKEYVEGVPVNDILKKHYISTFTLYKILKKHNVSRKKNTSHRHSSPSEMMEIFAKWVAGASKYRLAKEYGRPVSTIYYIIDRMLKQEPYRTHYKIIAEELGRTSKRIGIDRATLLLNPRYQRILENNIREISRKYQIPEQEIRNIITYYKKHIQAYTNKKKRTIKTTR